MSSSHDLTDKVNQEAPSLLDKVLVSKMPLQLQKDSIISKL